MADITKCNDLKCPLKNKCYRFTAKDSLVWQSYFTYSPYMTDTGDCEYFWQIKQPLPPKKPSKPTP